MSDLEMTKLCAEAMGYKIYQENSDYVHCEETGYYDPLRQDAQTMALVKRFDLCIQPPSVSGKTGGKWHAWLHHKPNHTGVNADLNRAVVECVAKLEEYVRTATAPPQ